MRILLLNGPNLHLLGTREPDVYGSSSLEEIVKQVEARARELDAEVVAKQTNDEGELVTLIGGAEEYDGILINPAAYTRYPRKTGYVAWPNASRSAFWWRGDKPVSTTAVRSSSFINCSLLFPTSH